MGMNKAMTDVTTCQANLEIPTTVTVTCHGGWDFQVSVTRRYNQVRIVGYHVSGST